ncbi:TIGR02647 family protein [Gilvimarinus polysaccharolyticus]|uniref:TIGR02647 family protein n=1 Tax=Gilvimarinus polysaccharolyticus TaxID=863921 RepID=UPI0006735831|nr:TIGR02647 family protein [Gilvimarinus polysaccharolyticus]
MSISSELVDEITVLRSFDVSGTQIGIKVHSDAAPAVVAATQRLHEKQLITQPDGGYLTTLGYEAAVHVQQALQILTSPVTA